jgi:hypothetical protein
MASLQPTTSLTHRRDGFTATHNLADSPPYWLHCDLSVGRTHQVREAYFQAAQTSPDMVDADVQVGLGVLFNINHEYDKAVTCFETALSARSVTSCLVGFRHVTPRLIPPKFNAYGLSFS